MGTVLHPVGPLPPGAYWLRRLLAVVIVLVVLLVGWELLGLGSGGTPSATGGTPSTSPTPSSSTPSPTRSTTSPTATATATKPSATTTAATPGLCPDAVIKVVASTDHSTYAAGEDPRLTVTVTNSGSTSCKRDVGQAASELRVLSGGARFWSSDDCHPGGPTAVTLLAPGQSATSSVTWTRVQSTAGCPSGEPTAKSGSYQVVGRNLTLLSAPVPFTLS